MNLEIFWERWRSRCDSTISPCSMGVFWNCLMFWKAVVLYFNSVTLLEHPPTFQLQNVGLLCEHWISISPCSLLLRYSLLGCFHLLERWVWIFALFFIQIRYHNLPKHTTLPENFYWAWKKSKKIIPGLTAPKIFPDSRFWYHLMSSRELGKRK